MNIIIIKPLYNNDKHWNTEWLTLTDTRTADSAANEIENRHHL